MTHEISDDYDKKFKEDLDKATALSLEQQALDEYRRAKKYSNYTIPGPHLLQGQGSNKNGAIYSKDNGQAGGRQSTSSSSSFTEQQQDLISFSASSNSERLQLITTTDPTASGSAMNSLLLNDDNVTKSQHFKCSYTSNQYSANTNSPQEGRKPSITGKDLEMLYNMPYMPNAVAAAHHPVLMQNQRLNYYHPAQFVYPPIVAAGNAVAPYMPTPPPPGFILNMNHYHFNPTHSVLPRITNYETVHRNMVEQTNNLSLVPQVPPRHSLTKPPNSEEGHRKRELAELQNAAQQRTSTDGNLIDLNKDDTLRVSVIEAFDPLVNVADDGFKSDSTKIDSYYTEYDPFDYWLTEQYTNRTDPIYEAVNKSTSSSCAEEDTHNSSQLKNILDFKRETFESSNYASADIVESKEKSLATGSTPKLHELIADQRSIDSELLEFYFMVKEVRACYSHDDEATNVGHIIASEFNYHYPEGTSIKVVVHPALDILLPESKILLSSKQQLENYGDPIAFTCDVTSTVDLIINQVVCSLEGHIHRKAEDYAMRPIGLAEWLSPSSKLNQLQFVHNSLKLEKDVHFGLCLKTPQNMRALARTINDDLQDANLRPEDVLPSDAGTTITYDDMMVLIGTFEMEVDKFKKNLKNSSPSTVSCSRVVQAVKAICCSLGSIETLEIQNCVKKLVKACNPSYCTPLASYVDRTANRNSSGSQEFDSSDEQFCWQNISLQCDELSESILNLIKLYARTVRVRFSVKQIDEPAAADTLNISCVSKPFVVIVKCLHRPSPLWKFDSYTLSAQINYGTRFISDIIVAKCSSDASGGLFACLEFSSWLSFNKNMVCTLPLESRLVIVVYGTQIPENDHSSNSEAVADEKKQVTVELGWCAMQLFDHKREFVYGSYLLPVWPPSNDKLLGPAPSRTCNPNADICPFLSIDIPSYGGRIEFPETERNMPAQKHDLRLLDSNLQQDLLDTAEQGYSGATDKREVFWEKRHYLHNIPHALPKVLHAAHSWDYASIIDLHALLDSWAPLSPLQAFELLLPRYPDVRVREKAVEWISSLPNDHLVDFLPQLLQSLKHDTYEASAMARFLLCKSLESPRIAQHMYWLLVHSLPGDDPHNSTNETMDVNEHFRYSHFHRRNQMMLRALLAVCGENLLSRFLRQNMMCKILFQIAESVKDVKESLKQMTLTTGMASVHQDLADKPTSLPLGPEFEVSGVNVRSSSYFNSKAMPLKVAYIGTDEQLLPALFKVGDDLRQDMLTIQLIRMMDKVWLADGLDLKIITFSCVPTGHRKGMIEMVPDAETLRKIQIEYGLTGSFKDRPIAEWLAKHNPSQLEYQRAVKNFTVSCAGYSVATYLLGICDRHNDNIMLKTSGHLFHIDFGKFLGDAQMFGNFKRDRTPFVLTSDMAYVINGGDKLSTDFHYFVDLCCRAFNIVRKHGDLILHLLALMATAEIPGVTADAVTYVRRALLPSQSNPEAAAFFAKMIQSSLKNWFTQFNFFLHNLAQIRFSSYEEGGELLSFVPRKYTMQQDGRLKSVMVVRYQKHYDTEKYYTYILRVTRHNQPDPTYLFRTYKEFTEFHQKLCLNFPLAKLHSLTSGVYVGRSNIKSVAERRLPEIQRFLISLFNSADEISHSDLVYTFFHPILRDQQEAKLGASKVKVDSKKFFCENSYEVGELKTSFQYRRGALTVMIHHAKGLPLLQGSQEPNTYVKCYLKPDPTKQTKRKTKVVRKTCVPSFMETIEYRMPLEHIQDKVLHVTVWSHDNLQENELLGGFYIELRKYDLSQEVVDWFRLGPVSRS